MSLKNKRVKDRRQRWYPPLYLSFRKEIPNRSISDDGSPYHTAPRILRFGFLQEDNVGISVAANQAQLAAVEPPAKVLDLL